jgi:hypothetical protein
VVTRTEQCLLSLHWATGFAGDYDWDSLQDIIRTPNILLLLLPESFSYTNISNHQLPCLKSPTLRAGSATSQQNGAQSRTCRTGAEEADRNDHHGPWAWRWVGMSHL